MKKIFVLFFLLLILLFPLTSESTANLEKEHDHILTSAESLFKMMKERNIERIWFYLSKKSRSSIIEDTYKAMVNHEKGRGNELGFSKEEIDRDFTNGGAIAKVYWKSYLENFDPDLVLEQSRWAMGKVSKDRAQINVTYKKAERPAIIQMYKEAGRWRVGLTETFASSKR
jgi:hypothetical protein